MPTAEVIRVENLTASPMFLRFTIIRSVLRLEVFPDDQDGCFLILPGHFAATAVTPEIRACYAGSMLTYEFTHHVSGGLDLQYPQQAERLTDGRYAAVFRLRLPIS